eukprot:543015-Prymnesium_polylepis.1
MRTTGRPGVRSKAYQRQYVTTVQLAPVWALRGAQGRWRAARQRAGQLKRPAGGCRAGDEGTGVRHR